MLIAPHARKSDVPPLALQQFKNGYDDLLCVPLCLHAYLPALDDGIGAASTLAGPVHRRQPGKEEGKKRYTSVVVVVCIICLHHI